MTERSAAALARDAGTFTVGPSSLAWDGTSLTLRVDERGCPIPRRLAGRITLTPEAMGAETVALDAAGRHRWTPFSAYARVSVAFDSPRLAWSGHGYLDSNAGDEPLAAAFSRWDWARAQAGGEATILYDADRRDGTRFALALAARRDGGFDRREMPKRHPLPPTRIWRIRRLGHGEAPRIVATLEDTPFYARSVVAARLFGREATAVHESLDLDRFATRWVKALLPFRMPRLG